MTQRPANDHLEAMRSLEPLENAGAAARELWVFGYGSLMWRPGFPFAERCKAQLEGFTRRLCIWSRSYRGTPEAPGLVFGLAPGGACHGVAFRVEPERTDETLHYLRERELSGGAYHEIVTPAKLDDGRRVPALAYVANDATVQFAGSLPHQEALTIIQRSCGKFGTNVEYVLNTRAELGRLGISDEDLEAICARLTR